MKRRRIAAGLVVLLILGGAVWWWTGPRHALNGPPKLTVLAGSGETKVGYWSADWASPTTGFSACGASPTDPAARYELTVIYLEGREDTLTLSYPTAPSHLTVSFTPDRGGETVCLYDGWGRRKLAIPLPEYFLSVTISHIYNIFSGMLPI